MCLALQYQHVCAGVHAWRRGRVFALLERLQTTAFCFFCFVILCVCVKEIFPTNMFLTFFIIKSNKFMMEYLEIAKKKKKIFHQAKSQRPPILLISHVFPLFCFLKLLYLFAVLGFCGGSSTQLQVFLSPGNLS